MAKRNQQIEATVKTIGSKYFVDAKMQVGNDTVEHWKTLMGVFTCLGNRNAILQGRPGTGKTTWAAVISSVLYGLPYDLFDTLKIQGHPDQTKDTMLARVDLGRLAEEGVVWQPSVYLPTLTMDEINRNTAGKQSIFMEYVRTGVVEHLGKHLDRGKVPFFATMNYNGAGTHELPRAMLDRFDISLEFPVGTAFIQDDIQAARDRIEGELANRDLTDRLMKQLLDKDKKLSDKLAILEDAGKKKRASIDGSAALAAAKDVKYTPQALTFLRCVWEEINTTPRYGEKRSCDPRDESNHNEKFANYAVNEGISPRAWDAIDFYARMLTTYLGYNEVELEHVTAVAPFCISHRVAFTEDYNAKFKEQPRLQGENQELDLTRRLLQQVKTNYDEVAAPLKTLDDWFAHKDDTAAQRRATQICQRPEPDHPLLRQYYKEAKEILGV